MKRLIFWDFPRAGWQYDIAVGAILAFIFLTPRSVFKDQPRPSSIAQMPSETGSTVYWLESGLMDGYTAPDAQATRASELLAGRMGKKLKVSRVEPFVDAEQEVRGYIAIVKP